MKKRIINYLIALLVLWTPAAFAQRDYSPEDRDRIADNISGLIQDFLNTLSFNNSIDASTVEMFFRNYGDSLALIKLDSLKQTNRLSAAENIKSNFRITRRGDMPLVSNFMFDTTLHSLPGQFGVDYFAEQLTEVYESVQKSSEPVMFLDQNERPVQQLRPLMREMQIEKERGGNSVVVNFEIGWLMLYYDSLSPANKNLGKLPEFYESNNIRLTSKIFFKKPNDRKSFSFQEIRNVGEMPQAFILDDVKNLIESSIINNFQLYATISRDGQPPDPSLAANFINLFNDPDKQSIQCNLFFPDDVCENATDISARHYADKIIQHYESIEPLALIANYDSLSLIEKTSIDYLFKLPVKFSFIAFDKNDDVFDNQDTTYTTFYIRLNYERSLLTGREDLKEARLTDIASYDKKIAVTRPYKKGNWAIAATYQPGMMFYQTEGDFSNYKQQFSLSNSFGISGQYLWFAKKNGTVVHNESYGVSIGFFFDSHLSKMKFDKFNYANITPGAANEPFHRLNFADTLNVALSDYGQELAYNAYSISVLGHYKKDLSEKAFLTLSAGLQFTLPDENSIKLAQNSGIADYTGIKWVTSFPDNYEGAYFLENLESKGFYNYDAQLNDEGIQINQMITYLVINPTISFSIDNTIENGFIDLGLNLKYGFNPLFDNGEKHNYLVDSHGTSHSVFTNGIKSNHFFVGLTIGFRFFDEKKIRDFKTIK